MTKKDKFLAAAQKYLEKGSLDKALAEFGRAVQEDPKDTRTWLRIAEIHVKRHENDKATEVYLRTADLYVEQGFFQRAVAVYKNVVKLAPAYVEAHLKLADIYKQLGLLSDAMQQLELAAAAYQKTGRTKEAIGAMRQMVELTPEQPLPHIKLGEAAVQAGANDEAVRAFGRATELLKGQGRIDEYLRVAERLLHVDPQNTALAKQVATRYLERQNARFALARLQGCFASDPRDVETLDLLARAFEQLGQNSKSASVLKELAKVHGEAGRPNDRLEVMQRVLTLEPHDPDARQALARPAAAPPVPAPAPPAPPRPPPTLPRPEPPPSRPTVQPVITGSPELGAKRRLPSITFSEMAVPNFALFGKDLTPAPAPVESPAVRTTAEREAIASDLLEKNDADANAEAQRIVSEADVFVKYGLVERAVDHLRKVFTVAPRHVGARERLAAVLLQNGKTAEAVTELETIAEQLLPSDPDGAATYARRALSVDPRAVRARVVIDEALGAPSTTHQARPFLSGPELIDMETPRPVPLEDTTFEEAPFEEPPFQSPFEEAPFGAIGTSDGATRIEMPPLDLSRDLPVSSRRDVSPPREQMTPQPITPRPVDHAPARGRERIEQERRALALDEERFDRVERTQTDSAPDPALLGELEQVDFFIEQGIAEEAAALLDDLEERFPGDPAIATRRARLAAEQPSVPDGAIPGERYGGSSSGPAITPRAMVAGGGSADLSTHADLGIAYKEMGLFDAAVKEFTVLSQDPGREVFALTMIGECHEARGATAEAVLHYKKALNRPNVTEGEATQLYFQLGNVFQQLGERNEALYFYEKVAKRDPAFRDVRRRLAEVRAQTLGARPTAATPDEAHESLDRAFDAILSPGKRTGGR